MARNTKTGEPRKRSNPDKEFCNSYLKPPSAKTEKQRLLYKKLNESDIIFATGPAGTGKSHVALSYALDNLMRGVFDRLLITRPMLTVASEEVGALPGDLDDKFTRPYIGPVRPIIEDCIGKGHTEMYLKEGSIVAVPLAFMRGSTWNKTCMILDEAQNCVPEQIKMFLTRIGEGSKCILTGDSRQSDLRGPSGLDDAVARLKWHPNISVVEFDRNDIVRHSIISDILQSYEG